MEQYKGLIIGAVLLLSLFALSLALGFRPKANDDLASRSQDEKNSEASKSGQGSWISVMDDLLSPLAPSVKVDELKPVEASCIMSENNLILNSSAKCSVQVAPSKKQRRTLVVNAKPGVSLLVPGALNEICPAASAPIRVRVTFEMNGVSSTQDNPRCWKPAPRNPQRYKTPVLAKGGNLTLLCEGCGNQNGEVAILSFEE